MPNLEGIDWKQKLEASTLTTPPASDAQAVAKEATDKAITPGNLAALGSTATFAGLTELATAAEALAGTDTARAVTPAGLQGAIDKQTGLTFMGRSGSGACTLSGVKVNDIVLSVTGISGSPIVGDQSSKFESTISVADQIQQSNTGDLSANMYFTYIQQKS